ncbi:MAG: SHOCT domain-containing protein [Limnothrix sp. BL-A-16]|jgi:hypothetical protein
MDFQRLQSIADRHGFSLAAVSHLADRIRSGRGAMAQFNHPELGGSGQWMQGGMLMIGDLFNQSLKARVANLCQDLYQDWCQTGATEFPASPPSGVSHSTQVQFQSAPIAPPSQPSRQPSSPAPSSQPSSQPFNQPSSQPLYSWNPMPPMDFGAGDCWWPIDWGQPSIQGRQNHLDYAYFASFNRLALRQGAMVTFYDTTGYQITGFSQQQTTESQGLICFSSRGQVAVRQFPQLV